MLGVFAEIVVFALSPRFALAPALEVVIGALSAVTRWLIYAQEPTFAVLSVVQLAHGLSYGLTQVGTMNLLVRHVPVHLMARGQGYLAACSGIVSVCASILSGIIYGRYGQGVYYLMVAMAASGAMVMWLARHIRSSFGAAAAAGTDVALPILAFLGAMAALYGGGLVAWHTAGSIPAFLLRLRDAILIDHFIVGIVRAPVMAAVIGIVACVEPYGRGQCGIARSAHRVLGRERIFFVIVMDGVFMIFHVASIGI